MSTTPSSTPSKAEEIAAVLRTEILRGQYRAGERLPSERDLAARFEANRGAIREALKKLEQLGIASVTPGGVRVTPVEEATLEVLGYLLELGQSKKTELVGQMLDVMASMMALSTRSSIEAATAEQLELLTEGAGKLVDSVGEDTEHNEAWREFGEIMIPIHQNLVLRLVGNGVRTQFLGAITSLDVEPDIDLNALTQHLKDLQNAIRNKQSFAASSSIIQYFLVVKQGVLPAALEQASLEQPMPMEAQLRTQHG